MRYKAHSPGCTAPGSYGSAHGKTSDHLRTIHPVHVAMQGSTITSEAHCESCLYATAFFQRHRKFKRGWCASLSTGLRQTPLRVGHSGGVVPPVKRRG